MRYDASVEFSCQLPEWTTDCSQGCTPARRVATTPRERRKNVALSMKSSTKANSGALCAVSFLQQSVPAETKKKLYTARDALSFPARQWFNQAQV